VKREASLLCLTKLFSSAKSKHKPNKAFPLTTKNMKFSASTLILLAIVLQASNTGASELSDGMQKPMEVDIKNVPRALQDKIVGGDEAKPREYPYYGTLFCVLGSIGLKSIPRWISSFLSYALATSIFSSRTGS